MTALKNPFAAFDTENSIKIRSNASIRAFVELSLDQLDAVEGAIAELRQDNYIKPLRAIGRAFSQLEDGAEGLGQAQLAHCCRRVDALCTMVSAEAVAYDKKLITSLLECHRCVGLALLKLFVSGHDQEIAPESARLRSAIERVEPAVARFTDSTQLSYLAMH